MGGYVLLLEHFLKVHYVIVLQWLAIFFARFL